MKTVKMILLSVAFTAALVSCKNEAANDADAIVLTEDETNHDEHAMENHDDMEHHDVDESVVSEPISLNDGEKWVVNEEMKPFVSQGENLVNTYDGDHKALAVNLTEQNNQLIKSCTMEGTSHDELHKWLHPHLEMVKELGDMDHQEAADKQVDEIKNSYQVYHEYFQ